MPNTFRFKIRGAAAAPILALSITGTPTPITTQNAAYTTFTPSASGGVAPYTFALTGTLPAGLSFSTSTGAISGTSTAVETASGLNITVTDAVLSTKSLGVFSIQSVASVVSDASVAIAQTDEQFVDVTTWLATIPDNEITVTVTGEVSMQAWGYYQLQTDGETRVWNKRHLAEYLVAKTTGAAIATGTWALSALDGVGETGSTSTFNVSFPVQATPVMEFDASIYSLAGMGGAQLSLLGSATDWTLDSQSTSGLLAMWDYNQSASARVALASSAGVDLGYLGARDVTPTVGTHTATVSSATLGISGRVITFNFLDTIQADVAPCPYRDTEAAPFDQLGYVIANGNSAGQLTWGSGDILTHQGVFNPTATNHGVTPGQPQGTAPASPYGTNAAQSWDYEDGWNPNWITVRPDRPLGTQIQSMRFDLAGLTSQTWGYRFSGLDLYKGTNTSSASLYIYDNGSTTRGIHKVAIDHCVRANIVLNFEGDYSDMLIVAYNDLDADDYDATSIGVVGKDCQIIGNVFRNWIGDMINGFTYNSVVGSGKTKTSWNVSVDKKLTLEAHSDFYQTHAYTATQYRSSTLTPAATVIDMGEWVGNWCTKGKGTRFTAADVGYAGVYFQSASVSSPGFSVGDTLDNGAGKTATVISVENARFVYAQFASGVTPFGNGELITVTAGTGTGTTAVTNFNLAFSSIVGSGFEVGDVLSNAGATKTAQVLSLNSASSLNLQLLTGSIFSNGEAVTASISGTTANRTSATSAASYTTWAGGMITTADIGKCPGDCQGMYQGAPQTPLTGIEHFRGDIPHVIFMAGWITEGLSSYGIYRLPPAYDDPSYVVVNNLVTPPWGTISEVGTGGYYDAGRFAIGGGTIFPASSAISQTASIGTRTIGRNVFVCGNGFAGTTGINDLNGSSFGSPTDAVTVIPTQVTGAFTDPGGTATRNGIPDIVDDYTPVAGGILTTQGTPVDFGAIVPEIDYGRHTYDRTALATLV